MLWLGEVLPGDVGQILIEEEHGGLNAKMLDQPGAKVLGHLVRHVFAQLTEDLGDEKHRLSLVVGVDEPCAGLAPHEMASEHGGPGRISHLARPDFQRCRFVEGREQVSVARESES